MGTFLPAVLLALLLHAQVSTSVASGIRRNGGADLADGHLPTSVRMPKSSSEFYNYTEMLGLYRLETTMGDRYRCPKSFNFKKVTTPDPGKTYAYRLPHDKIYAEGKVCSPFSGPFVAEYSFLENRKFIPAEFITVLKSYDIGRILMAKFEDPRTIGAGSRIFYGFDANKRNCGKYKFYGEDGKQTTLTIFFAHKDVIKLPELGYFNAGRKHMITVVRSSTATFAMCSYSAPLPYYANKPIPTQFVNPSTSPSPTPTSSPSPSPSTSPNTLPPFGSSADTRARKQTTKVCFPASAMVHSRGEMKRMADVRVGDEVLVGAGRFSRVFMFTHRQQGIYEFLRFTTADGNVLVATAGHLVYANGALKTARSVRILESLDHVSHGSVPVVKIEVVEEEGLYNPQTEHGDIVVAGFRVSTFTETVEPKAAHALLSVFRFVRRYAGISSTFLENGSSLSFF